MASRVRRNIVAVRFSEAERKMLDDIADKNGISLSDVIRMCVRQVAGVRLVNLAKAKKRGGR